jgi:N-acetylmuramoyl-L-alanine amidase
VHCNASPDKTKFGSATYVMGLYKAEGNLEVSKRENSSVLFEKDYKKTYDGFDPNSDEGNILFAMYQNTYLEQSLDLAAKIQKEYANKAGRTDNGVKQAGFLVLWKTAMPSLLTEIGFLTNPKEETYIGSHKGQDQIAECLFFALQEYIDEKEGLSFAPGDYKFAPDKPDSLSVDDSASVLPDSANSPVKVDTVKPPSPKTNPVKTPKKGNTKSTNKMKESVKVWHTDTTAISNAADTSKIVYKVQIVSSPKALVIDSIKFKDVPDVEMYMDKGTYKYTAGHFDSVDEAVKLQTKLRDQGFKGAFVVAFKGKNRVPVKASK